MLEKSPEITRLVGHSLGSAVTNTLDQNFPNKYETTVYATPAVKPKRKGKQNPKHRDFIAILTTLLVFLMGMLSHQTSTIQIH